MGQSSSFIEHTERWVTHHRFISQTPKANTHIYVHTQTHTVASLISQLTK